MRKLTIDISGKEYSFGLNKEEIKRGERIGWSPALAEKQPLIQVYLTWATGIHLYHPNLSIKECEDLYEKYAEEGGDCSEVISFIMDEYQTFFKTTQLNTAKKAKITVV